ncbi:MAG: MBG domain-containing protein, partial [Tepidisphaeraceae bacterium]
MTFSDYYVYDGTPHPADASAVGSDGVTPVDGSFAFTYNGSPDVPVNAGTYNVVATFTSADPQYVNTVASDSWAAVSTMPLAASGTAAVFGAYGQIYLIGGLTAGG